MIVQQLHAIQHVHGFLPEHELRALAARTGTRLHRLQEVASFFPHFRLESPAPIQVRICQDMSCQIRGSCDLITKLTAANEGLDGVQLDVQGVSCLGRCDRAPVAFVASRLKSNTTQPGEGAEHEHVHYYATLDHAKLHDLVRKTIAGVQNSDTSLLPPGDTDVQWQAAASRNWKIDPYQGLPKAERYQTVRRLINQTGKIDPVVDRYNLKGVPFDFQSDLDSWLVGGGESDKLPQGDIRFSDRYRKQVLLVCIWKSGCESSTENIRQMEKLYNLLGNHVVRGGLNVLGINTEDSKTIVQEFIRENESGWNQIYGPQAKKVVDSLGILDCPAVLLVGSDGKIISSGKSAANIEHPVQKTLLESALRMPLEDYLDTAGQKILCSLFTANLLGMGGAGGRAYKKMFEVLVAKGDSKYVVCNGDESEPGTFKDREILLRTPHLVVEAVVLAGLLLNANHGYIYIRHEFKEQIEAVRNEIREAERLGVCGENIGPGLSFPVEVFVSPGGYICGEQSALIEALEDKRAEPRNRPPELQTNGLWDCPTLLNNVETLAWIPAIVLRESGIWFANEGSDRDATYKGRRFFSISGDVAKSGVYEVPIGITLGELINQYAGGMADGLQLKAAALSGPSGGFLPRKVPVGYLNGRWVKQHLPAEISDFDLLDMELDIQVSRDMGIMMGAGMVVFGDQTDMVATALSATTFYRNESCGKCVPCRIGSQKLVEILTDISNGEYSAEEIYGSSSGGTNGKQGLVSELSETMKLTAICGLGTVASNPLTTLLNYFRADVERYAKG